MVLIEPRPVFFFGFLFFFSPRVKDRVDLRLILRGSINLIILKPNDNGTARQGLMWHVLVKQDETLILLAAASIKYCVIVCLPAAHSNH